MAAKGISIGTDERKAFDYLFNKADSEQLGVLTGDKAVEFFDAAQLPPQILGEIWALADDENTGFLTKDQFYAVCRMIGHAQHGVQDINPALLKKAGPLPVFKGMTIPGVSASRQGQGRPPSRQGTASPAPPASRQPQQPQQQQGISISPEDKTKYTRLFYNSGAVNGLLDGDKARDILMKSRLPNETLGQIWNLSDTQSRGSLDAADFTIAMALINATMSGKLPSLPDTLPVSVYAQAAAAPPGGAAGVLPSSPLRAQMTGGSAAGPLYPQATGQGQRGPLGGMSASQSQGSLSGFSSAGAGGAAWAISPAEKAQSDQFFSMLDTARSGYITGDVAVPFFIQSGLPEDTLASIWDLADLTKEGNLNAAEFAVARRLIMDALQGKPVPQTLEESMIPPAMRSQVRQIQQRPQQSEVQKDLFSLMDDDDEPSAPVLPAATAASAFQPMSSFSSPQQQPARVTSPAPMQPMQPQRTGGSVARGFPAPIVPTPTGGSARSGTAMRSPPPPVPSSRSGSVLSAPAPAPAPAASRHTFETNFHDDSDDDDVSAAPAPASVSASRAQEQEQAPDRSGELDDLRKQVSSAQQRASGLRDQRTALSESTAKVDAEIDELNTKLAQAKAAYDVESTNLSNLEARQKTGNDELKRLRSETISAESDLSAAREQKIELEQGILKDKEEVRDLGKKLKTTNDEVAALKTELEKLKKEARQQKGLLAVHRKQASTAESERDKMRSAIEQEKQDASATAAELASLQSQAQSNRASPSAVPLPASNVASPAPSVGSQRSMNPFFATGGLAAPVAAAARAPSPLAAFDSAPTSHEQTAEEGLDPFGVSTSPRAASPFGSSAQPQQTQQPASMSGFDDAFGASSEPVSTGAVPTQQELEQQPVAATVGVLRGAEPTPGANTAFDDAFAEFDAAPAAAVASGEQAGPHNQEREVPADAKEGEAAADSGVGAAAAAVVGAAGAAIGAAAAGVYALASGEESTSPASVTDAPTGALTAEDKGKGRDVQGGEGVLQDSSTTLSAPASTQAYESRAINDDGSDSGDEVGDGSADLPPIKDMEIADNDDDSDSESDESVAGGIVARSDGGRGGPSAIPASTTPYGQSPYDPSPFGDSSSVPAGEDQAAQPEDTAEAGPARAVKGSDPFPGAFPASGTGSAGSSVGDADEAFEDARSTSAGPHSSTSPAIAAFSSPPQVQPGELPLPVTAGPGAGLDSSAQPQSATSTGFDDTFASATEAAQPSRGTSSDSPAREEAFLAAVPTAGGPAPAAGSAVQAETDDFDDFEDLAPARMEEPSAQASGTLQPTHAAGSPTFNDNLDDDFGFDKQTFSHTITSAGVGKATEPVGVVASPSHSRGPSGGRSGGFDDAFDDAFGVPATTSATGVTGTSSKPSAAAVGFDDDFFSSPMPTQSASTTADNNNGSNAGNASGFGSDFSSSSLPAGAAPYTYSMSADGQPQMHVVSSTPVVTSSASNPPPVAPGEPAPSYAPPPGPPPASAYQQSQSQQREPRQSAIPPTPPRAQSQSQSRQAPAIPDRRGTPTGTPSSARRSGRQDPTEGADTSGDLPAVKELVNMGFKRSQAIAALEDNQFNLERAANALLAVNQ